MTLKIASLCVTLALCGASAASAITVPSGFVVENVAPGAAFDTPTAMAFVPGGRILVAEKRGRVYAVRNGVKNSTPMWSRQNEVLNINDRGLLDVAVDPNFVQNRYIYLLYTVDPDSDSVDQGVAFGRLTRYQVSASDSNVVDPDSRTILMGVSWSSGPCSGSGSHTIGSLRWGTDGSLLVSAGEGAEYVDDSGGQHPEMFLPGRVDPYEDIGSFRAQYIGSLAGKILRINPQNGLGYPSNPYYNGDPGAAQSKVWAYGLRNPFRFGVEPGSGSTNPAAGNPGVIFVGDVGSNTWEEIDVVTQPGQNFGWPCYEGPAQGYLHDANVSHNGCGSVGSPTNPASFRAPLSSWHHWNADVGTPPGWIGNASIGGTFYSGDQYPSPYRNRYFFADFGTSVIKVLLTDSNHNLTGMLDFATDANGPVDLVPDPASNDIYFVSIYDGHINRIRYTGSVGGNGSPVASASGAPLNGANPLTVSFSSAGSSDPDQDPITTTWLFGDGGGSSDPNPQHTFNSSGTYQTVLTVDDPFGGYDRDTVVVTVTGAASGFPTAGVLDDFNRTNGAIGPSWIGDTSGLLVDQNRLRLGSSDAWGLWNNASFGPWQEAYFRLPVTTPSAPEHDLMLKVQGTSWSAGEIEVRYDAVAGRIVVSTYDPAGGWVHHGQFNATLQAGDQFGARADAAGLVQVFVNGAMLSSVSVASWPAHAAGGRIGLTLVGATLSRVDDFGGGNVSVNPNSAPQAAILGPPNGSFFADGDTIELLGNGTDAEQPTDSLLYHWRVDVHHNTHVHPSSYVADARNASFIADNHDDGTGIWYEIHLDVTDGGGLQDTETIALYTETDIQPSAVTVVPETPATGSPAQYSFMLHNHGRMLAPRFHWVLQADGTALASGDTTIAADDSVWIDVTAPPLLSAGLHDLRLAVDSLGAVHETYESNNASTRPVTVIASVLSSGGGSIPGVALSRPFPNPSSGPVQLSLGLPVEAAVDFTVHDLQGREVWRMPRRHWPAGSWTLRWNGETGSGARARPGVYLARVTVDGAIFTRRLALMR